MAMHCILCKTATPLGHDTQLFGVLEHYVQLESQTSQFLLKLLLKYPLGQVFRQVPVIEL